MQAMQTNLDLHLTKNLKKKRKPAGQAILEYILLLAIVVPTLIFFVRKMTDASDQGTARYGGKLEKQLRTSNAPVDMWTK